MHRAFTLIELLVVISIIALLIAILLPALGAARRTAQISVCASNSHQNIVSGVAYSVDNRGELPRDAGPPQPFAGYVAWRAGVFSHLGQIWDQGYVSDARTFYCPLQIDPNFVYENYVGSNGWGEPATLAGVYVRTGYQFNNYRLEDGQPNNNHTTRTTWDEYENDEPIIHDIVSDKAYHVHDPEGGIHVGYSDGSVIFQRSPEAIAYWETVGDLSNSWVNYETVRDLFIDAP